MTLSAVLDVSRLCDSERHSPAGGACKAAVERDRRPPEELKKMLEAEAAGKPGVPQPVAIQARNLAKMNTAAGLRIGLGRSPKA